MAKRICTRIVLAVLVMAMLAGCAAQPTPTPVPPTPVPPKLVPTAEPVALQVAGKSLTLRELQSLPSAHVDADGTAFDGVPLLEVLKAANVSGPGTLTLTAKDGYTAEVASTALDDKSLLAIAADGALQTVLPGQSKAGWVKNLIKIEFVASGAEEKPVLQAGDKPFTMTDLHALTQVSVDFEGVTYKGVRVLDLLKAAGLAESETVKLIASDGYEASIAVKSLTDQSIFAYNDQSGVNTVLPDADKGSWVKYVIKIEAAGKAAGPPAPTPKPVAKENSVVVVDSMGNQVTIPKEVTRVASMRSGITEIICALGQTDKIVAVEEMTKAGTSYGEFIARLHPELMQAACPLSGDINVEEMLRIAPDLVLHGGAGRIKQADALKQQAPTLPVVIAHFETIEHYMDDVRIVAKCVNAEARGEELVNKLQAVLDDVRSRVKDIPPERKTKVMYTGHDIYHVYTPETFEHAQIDLAGGVNIAQDLKGWLPEVSPEQVLLWDPQVIVMLNGVDVNAILNDPKVASVSAIKNKRVYSLPEAGWDFSSPRALFCIEWLSSKLNPEAYSDVDIEVAANQFYRSVFGVNYTGPSLGGVAPAGMRQVTDMLGRRVDIPAHLSRVVSVFPYVTFAALALGGEKSLVAIDSASAGNANLARIYPVVKSLPTVGSAFSVNKESVLMAKPDVVVTVSWDSDPDKTQTTLGVPLVCVDMDKYKESIEFIADLFGPEAQAKAQQLVGYYEEKEALIAQKTADVAASQRPTVYVGGGNGFLSAFGKESTWHFEIEDAKGINVSADLVGGGSHDVSMEQLIAWNPDVIVLDKSCPDTLSSVLADARWQPINAVKNKRVYRAPNGFLDTWGRPHLESALCRLWLADKLYPGKLGIDIVEEAKAFYAKFYGVNLSSDEITKLLTPE